MNCNAAEILLNQAKQLTLEYSDVNPETAKTLVVPVLGRLSIAKQLPNIFFSKEEHDKYPALYLKRLITTATVKRFELEAKISILGKPFSMLQGKETREENIADLKETYEKIAGLDPTFIAPPLPKAEPFLSQKSSDGCYVATAIYGSYDCPEVWTLRRFRDNTLAKSFLGRLFILLYYAISPTLVKWFGETEWFKNMWKPILDKKVKKLNNSGVENTPYNDKQW